MATLKITYDGMLPKRIVPLDPGRENSPQYLSQTETIVGYCRGNKASEGLLHPQPKKARMATLTVTEGGRAFQAGSELLKAIREGEILRDNFRN